MTIAPDTCTFKTHVSAVSISYDMHPDVHTTDGVSLFIRNGYLSGLVTHADGGTSGITFYASGKWSSDWRTPNKRQARVLDSIAGMGLGNISLAIGNTAHHLIFEGLPSNKTQRSMFARRLGLELGENDAVTKPGASIQYVCSQGWRHSL